MTNSFRRLPYASYGGGSQQKDKRIGNRRMRRANRVLVLQDPEAVFRSKDEMMNPYGWPQDGTRRYRPFSDDTRISFEESYRQWYRWAKAK